VYMVRWLDNIGSAREHAIISTKRTLLRAFNVRVSSRNDDVYKKTLSSFCLLQSNYPSTPLLRLCEHFMTPHNALPVFRPRYHSVLVLVLILVLIDSNRLIQCNTWHLDLLRNTWRWIRRRFYNEAHIRQRWYPHEGTSRCALEDMYSRNVSVVTKLWFMLSEQVACRDAVRRS